MRMERYEFSVSKNFLDYEFYSEGPKGVIKKMVKFEVVYLDGQRYFNLSLGDWDERRIKLENESVTNNLDKQKVLSTVGEIVLYFTDRFPGELVYAMGNTDSRTRLYQMSISKNWNQIEPLFHVFGYINNKWQQFQKNVNYDAFFVKRK
jgi:hypothetical protein